MISRISKVNFLKKISSQCRTLSTVAKAETSPISRESEYYDEAPYPPITRFPPKFIDLTDKTQKTRHDKIQSIETIEEKIIELNLPRYYGFKCLMLSDRFPYNPLPYVQFCTNTEFVEEKSHVEEDESQKIDEFLKLVKPELIESLEFEIDGFRKFFDIKQSNLTQNEIHRVKSGGIVSQLNRVLTNALGADNRHLLEADVDIEPRHEAFWFVGGIEPPQNIKKMKEGREFTKEHANDLLDRPFAYIGQPLLAVRHLHPLLPFEDIDFDSITARNEKIPQISLDPRKFGFITDHRHGTSIPGFWPGNVREYGMLSYQDRYQRSIRNPDYGGVDHDESLHAQAILSSFAWMHSQAFYHGFTSYQDMTYPFTTQTIITDGQLFSFYKYQLNTTVTHFHNPDGPNFKYNKCWGTKEMKLFDTIENGKIQGLNDDVLRNLLTFYLNQPVPRQHEMKPFLGAKEKKVADLENLEQRSWLEKQYKHLMSNRQRQYLVPEIYQWEKIYKIDHETRPFDKKLKFWERNINPFRRELDEHKPEYIPRPQKVGGLHDKLRYRATYYPKNHKFNIPKAQSWSMLGAPKNKYAQLMDRRRKSYNYY